MLLDDPSTFTHALAHLAEGLRWERAGVDHRQGEYVVGGEEVWQEGDLYVHRAWTAHGWGGDLPDDVSESFERWDEATLRERLGAELAGHAWDRAPRGAPVVSSAFDPLAPMPGARTSERPVSDHDLELVLDCLRRGYAFEQTGSETRGGSRVWGRERLRHVPPASGPSFVHERAWSRGAGDEVCVRAELLDETAVREWLRTRAEIVHWDRWPSGRM